ncbi:heterogeneous nuclear ribonucleoprotein U-like protein 1 [Quillaja saponaria]|uniref:Heterogeneous nuclear ribonucleoprotein U-like protein 1 n=1 Tax=Quillaja saponaria TaxID=32244 RepID=A0AAD7M3P4_QUISA|nr:heterogeneous nuclear ribonucleoprotein U-like protein 1 [Quillaja saponaria]
MASMKRELPKEDDREAKKGKLDVDDDVYVSSSKPRRVVLNPADCNLDFKIEGRGLLGSALHEKGFAYCWSGARANGALGSPIIALDMEALGKLSNAGKFLDYGERFGIGDTIVCAVDLESKPLASIGFSKNGKWLGTAIQFDATPLGLEVGSPAKDREWESVIFPHILLKNVVVQLQFSIEDGLIVEEGFKPWTAALEDGNTIRGPTFSNASDCEVIMMVGLPASGKSTWAEQWVKEHPGKRYVLLGTNLVLDQMKVPGLLRKNNYGERLLLTIGRLLLSYFRSLEELKWRSEKRSREMGKELPDDAVNQMLANFVLPMSKVMPGSDEYFDEVMFVELNRVESQRHLDQMKHALASAPKPNHSSSYSRESSIPVISQPSFAKSKNTSSSDGGGHWRDSYSPLPSCSYSFPSNVNATSQAAGSHGRVRSFPNIHLGNQNLPVPRGATYPDYPGYGSIPLVGIDYRDTEVGRPYGCPPVESKNNAISCSVPDPYKSSMSEQNTRMIPNFITHGGQYREPVPRGITDCREPEIGGPYCYPTVESNNASSPSFIPDCYRGSMNEPSSVVNTGLMSCSYNTHGRQYIGGPAISGFWSNPVIPWLAPNIWFTITPWDSASKTSLWKIAR